MAFTGGTEDLNTRVFSKLRDFPANLGNPTRTGAQDAIRSRIAPRNAWAFLYGRPAVSANLNLVSNDP